MSNSKPQADLTIACDLSVFSDTQREAHMADAGRLFGAVVAVRELSDGYAFKVPDEPGMLALIADFIRDESLCCPFFHFGLEVEPYREAIWLKLSGGEGVKPFVANELAGRLQDEIATAAGLR